jgi:hypothetical protein
MADRIQVVDCYSVTVGDRPGEGRRLLEHISEQGVSLVAFSATPIGEGQTRIDFIPEQRENLETAAEDAGIPLIGPRLAFLIQGEDRLGALHEHHLVLANAGVNVYASNGVCDGEGRYGFILWVKPEDFDGARAAFGID